MDREPETKRMRVSEDDSDCSQYSVKLHFSNSENEKWYKESLENPERFWGDLAKTRIRWMKEYDRVMDVDMSNGSIKWFLNGVLNVTGKQITL